MKRLIYLVLIASTIWGGKKLFSKKSVDVDDVEIIEVVDFDAVVVDPNAAKIVFQQPNTDNSTVGDRNMTVTACITSKTNVEEVNVTVNGRLVRGISVVRNDGCTNAVNQRITLDEGSNNIQIAVKNAAGWSTATRRVVYSSSASDEEERRYALVIGNAAYSHNALKNPVNDATDVSARLQRLGFETDLLTNQDKRGMIDAINVFANKTEYDALVFYYAGHGIQSNERSYLIPIDANIERESDLEHETIDVARILANMENSGAKTKIAVLDACRNNPLERSWNRSDRERGLAAMSAPSGTLIAYATAPNKVAADGEGRNSPFTSAFVRALDERQLHIGVFFVRVTRDVKQATNGRQEPWIQSSLSNDFFFNQ